MPGPKIGENGRKIAGKVHVFGGDDRGGDVIRPTEPTTMGAGLCRGAGNASPGRVPSNPVHYELARECESHVAPVYCFAD